MENASKALIMAAGVLIGIMILSMGVYLFQGAAQIPKDYNAKLEKEKTEAFNIKFENYNKDDISAQDIVTVINMAVENNRIYTEDNVDYYIKVYLNGRIVNGYDDSQKITLMEQVGGQETFSPYKCEKIVYSTVTGRVISIKFVEK